MAYTNKPIDWQNEGTEPSNTLKTNGFEMGMKPAADTFNYFWHNTGECISELQTKVGDPANLTTTAKTSLVEATNENKQNIDTKVDKVTGKGLSTEDYTTEEKTKLAGIAENANNYTLPTASTTTKGGVKVGDNLKITGEGVLSGGYTRESLTDVISGETGKVWSDSNITSGLYHDIVYANGLWVAGSNAGIKYSVDGKTWNSSNITTGSYYDIAYGNGLWVVGSNAGIKYSVDGKTWNDSNITSEYYRGMAYGNGLWVVGSNNGYGIKYSVDGKTWNDSNITSGSYATLVYGNGLWVAGSGGNTGIKYSVDGKTWNSSNITTGAFYAPTYANGLWVAGGSNTGIKYSVDGKTWNDSNITKNSYRYAAYGNGLWVAGGFQSGGGGTKYSVDGKTWSDSNITTGAFYAPTYANGLWVAGGSNTGIKYSVDGKTWNDSNITSGSYYDIAYANGLWVAGGGSTGIKYSTDGSYARTEHTHDDIYYTEAEIDQKLSGPYGKPFGYDTIADTYQTAIGRLNTASSGPTSVTDTSGDLFIIGNGTGSDNRGNALRTTTAGKTYGQATFANSGADYAEMWEIEGGNPNNEDWRGYFVTLNSNNKIEKASADSDFILGIVSGAACVLGDVHSEEWKNKYLRDVFGEKLTETVVISEEITDDDGNIVAPAVTETRWILNPEYDPTQEYISRENRKEWAGVGLVGKLVVIDDGTCTAGGYCKPTDNGTATKSETGWRVLERIDSTHIRVFFR